MKIKRFFGSLLTITILASLLPTFMLTASAESISVSYVERSWDGNKVVSTTKTVNATVVKSTDSDVDWYTGWYVVKDNVTINGRINVRKNKIANLILCDGATLTANEGIDVSKMRPEDTVNPGLIYTDTLNIYGQSEGTGTLIAYRGLLSVAPIGGGMDSGTTGANGGILTVHGGNIYAYNNMPIYGGVAAIGGGVADRGSGEGCDLTIYGGNVTAITDFNNPDLNDSYKGGAGIGGCLYANGGNVTIYGGNIKAIGGKGSEAIGKGEGGESSGTLKNGSGDVVLHTITIDDVADGTPITNIGGVNYSCSDMKTLDTNKAYVYLAADANPTSITVGGKTYALNCNKGTNHYTSHNLENGKCNNCDGLCPHQYVRRVIMEPECAVQGLAFYDCKICGVGYEEIIPSTGHDYTYSLVNYGSQHLGVCSICGNRTQASHSYTNTCMCLCGYIGRESPVHAYESVITPPTCTDAGYTTYTCTLCDKVTVDSDVAASGHSGGKITCTERAICDVCGEHYGEEPKGHGYAPDDDTCLTPVLCPDCGEATTPARDEHEWDEYNTCIYCGTDKPFVFTFTDGDKVVEKTDVRANEYYYFNVLENKDGLTFLGWDADGDGSADYAGLDMSSQIHVGGDMTFNAVYGDIFVVRYFRIGLDSGVYELSGISQVPEKGDPISLEYDYAYWYNALGWATEPNGEKVYNYGEEIEITSSINLYTVARPFEATVDLATEDAVWNDNDGNAITVIRGTVTDPNIYLYDFPERPGYKFMGFISDEYEYTYFDEDWETGEIYLCVYLNKDSAITAVWEECTEHNYVNGKCEHCGIADASSFAITAYSAKTALVASPEVGTYTVVFADYDGGKLANVEYAAVTFTEETKGTALSVSITKDFSLDSGDKIMLLSDMTTLAPKCKALTIK